MKLYNYFRSSAAYRLRIALNLKGIKREEIEIDLYRADGGAQHDQDYATKNPQKMVPALDVDGAVLTQSMALLEYLEERFPEPPLLPRNVTARAHVRAIANAVACDIHPLTTVRVAKQLRMQFGADQTAIDRWLGQWIGSGFEALEHMIGEDGHCFGGVTTMADVCLVPQVVSARRIGVDLEAFPRICKVADVCGSLPAFAMAHPSRHPASIQAPDCTNSDQ